ncbi:MAG TPA: YezD family protein [Thermoanaerobaculia bacterium]|nr:YezD family protein [Thermoanaerobaculia bacterium]
MSPLPQRAPVRMDEEEINRIEREVRLALSQIRYGSIEIVIQDSRVVQIERREKVRFERNERSTR